MAKNRGKLFVQREVFAENRTFVAEFLDHEDFSGRKRPTLRDHRPGHGQLFAIIQPGRRQLFAITPGAPTATANSS
jgi:hypothetical protein